jgi:hypothetical protein
MPAIMADHGVRIDRSSNALKYQFLETFVRRPMPAKEFSRE